MYDAHLNAESKPAVRALVARHMSDHLARWGTGDLLVIHRNDADDGIGQGRERESLPGAQKSFILLGSWQASFDRV